MTSFGLEIFIRHLYTQQILLQIKVYRYFKIGRKFYSWLVSSKDINNIIQGQLSCGLYQAITQSYLQLLARYSHVTNTRLIHLSKIIRSQALFLSNLNFNVQFLVILCLLRSVHLCFSVLIKIKQNKKIGHVF